MSMLKVRKQTEVSDKGSVRGNMSAWLSWQRVLLVVIPLVMYGKTIRFDFTDTDRIHITQNEAVQQGVLGIKDIFLTAPGEGDVYRPLTMTMFALEQTVFGSSAKWAHSMSILIYLILLQVLLTLVNTLYSGKNNWLPILVMLFFSMHPVHADIVSHIDYRHELLTMLLASVAWNRFLDSKSAGRTMHRVVIFVISLLAFLSGPNALLFLLVIPVSSWLIKGNTMAKIKVGTLAMLGAAIVWGILRYVLAREAEPTDAILPLQNILYSAQGLSQKVATGLGVFLQYIGLLVYPVGMPCDYSFAEMKVFGWNSAPPFASLVIILLMLFAVIRIKKTSGGMGFALVFILISLLPASQIFSFAESTIDKSLLFIPTLSFALLLGYSGIWLSERMTERGLAVQRWFSIGGILIFVAFWNLTGKRVADWQDNLTLYKSGVAASPKSAVMQYNLGYAFLEMSAAQSDNLVKEDFLERSRLHIDTSLTIFPENHKALYAKGVYYAAKADTANAISSYRKAIQIRASAKSSLNNLGVLYMGKMNYDSSFHYFNLSHQIKPDSNSTSNLAKLFYTVGLRYSGLGEITAAIDNYKKCLTYEPRNLMALNNLATIYANRNEFAAAQQYLLEALKASPNDAMVLENMAVISYLDQNMGQAIEYANRALKVDPSLKRCLAVLIDSYRAMGDEATALKYKQQYDALQ